ncbi:MAG TPA: hypothetical protein VNO32_04065, partial [Candidatus Acidoferrum sp.]|nr:hypothetical protein [Candidatus Acidoferrum sp.]
MIRLFCTAVALAGMLAAASVQAQESSNSSAQAQAGATTERLDAVSDTTRAPLADISQTAVSQTHFAQTRFVQTDDAQVVVAPPWVQDNAPQDPGSQDQTPPPTAKPTDGKASLPDSPKPQATPPTPTNADEDYGKQDKRILWVIPNYRAVSANTHLPPLSFKSEIWLATQDTFDYSDFIFVGALAG